MSASRKSHATPQPHPLFPGYRPVARAQEAFEARVSLMHALQRANGEPLASASLGELAQVADAARYLSWLARHGYARRYDYIYERGARHIRWVVTPQGRAVG